jgi:hypothetical protein
LSKEDPFHLPFISAVVLLLTKSLLFSIVVSPLFRQEIGTPLGFNGGTSGLSEWIGWLGDFELFGNDINI